MLRWESQFLFLAYFTMCLNAFLSKTLKKNVFHFDPSHCKYTPNKSLRAH